MILWRMLGIAVLAAAAFGAAFGIGRVSRHSARELHVALPRTTPAPTAGSPSPAARRHEARAARRVRRVRRHRAPARRSPRPAAAVAPAPRPVATPRPAPAAPPPAGAPATPPEPDPAPPSTPQSDGGQVFFDDTN